MTEDPKREVGLTPAGGDPRSALLALQSVIASAARSVGELAAGDDDVAALEAVILLDDALGEVGTLTQQVPRLLSVAQAGPAVELLFRERTAELSALGERLDAARAERDALDRSGDDLRARLAEHADLRQQVAELRRLERLVEALDELGEQRAVIDERIAALRQVGEVERALSGGGAELLRLTESRLAALEPENRRVLEHAAAAHRTLADEEARVEAERASAAAAADRYEELRLQREERVVSLEVYAKADRDLVDALAAVPELGGPVAEANGLATTRALLDDVERRLQQVDEVLARVLGSEGDRRRSERVVIGLSGDAG